MSDLLITALLGDNPAALTEDVSLATPLTAPRITGRDAVVAALGAYADVMGATDADLRLKGQDLEGAVFTTTVEGHTAQVLALGTYEASGLIATIDIYGRPCPYMGWEAIMTTPCTYLDQLHPASPSRMSARTARDIEKCI